VLGLAATSLMTLYRSPTTDKPGTRAGLGYATLWVLVITGRSAFSYGSTHWFGLQLATWTAQHSISSNAITGALIFMAVGMLVTRTIGIMVRAKHLVPRPVPEIVRNPE
jgi:hypothetical protein